MIKRISIFHYHFLPGGVTTVIRDAALVILKFFPEISELSLISGRIDNLEDTCAKIQSGLPGSDGPQVTFRHVPLFAYQEETGLQPDSVETGVTGVRKHLSELMTGPDHLWIIHNHHIGKNPFFTRAVTDIAKEGRQKILFHIHDFPESARFSNWENLKKVQTDSPYPRNSNIRYAVINSRDRNFMVQEGMPENEVYLIKDPVRAPDPEAFSGDREKKARIFQSLYKAYRGEYPSYDPEGLHFIYPVRTIRRKNPLEAGLFCEMLGEYLGINVNLILTLPGVSEREKRFSGLVEETFRKGQIPGLFGIGRTLEQKAKIGFTDLVMASDAVISSSVQEGFGYLYLNALQWNKPLISRYLDVMADIESFLNQSNSFLYDSLLIPLENREKQKIRELYNKKIGLWESVVSDGKAEALYLSAARMFESSSIDFSYLPVSKQQEILRKIRNDRAFLQNLTEINRNQLTSAGFLLKTPEISNNIDQIDSQFGENAQRETLGRILDFFNSEPSLNNYFPGKSIESLWNSFATLPHLKLLYDFE